MTIRDMLHVKSIEKQIGRALTEDEMDGEYFFVQMPGGRYREFRVPLLEMPWDLMSCIDGAYVAEVPYSHNKLNYVHDADVWTMKRRPPEYLSIWEVE